MFSSSEMSVLYDESGLVRPFASYDLFLLFSQYSKIGLSYQSHISSATVCKNSITHRAWVDDHVIGILIFGSGIVFILSPWFRELL